MAAELEIFDNGEIANEMLSSQFQKPEFQKIAAFIGLMFDRMNLPNFQIRDGFWIQDAVDMELTILGKVWNVYRSGKSDAALRAEILIAAGRTSSGTMPEILSALLTQFGATYAEGYWMYGIGREAEYYVITDATITQLELERISAAGVGVSFGDYIIGNDGINLIGNDGEYLSSVG